jgi:hypothetical protein
MLRRTAKRRGLSKRSEWTFAGGPTARLFMRASVRHRMSYARDRFDFKHNDFARQSRDAFGQFPMPGQRISVALRLPP